MVAGGDDTTRPRHHGTLNGITSQIRNQFLKEQVWQGWVRSGQLRLGQLGLSQLRLGQVQVLG
jgi:hypothetical protein